MRLPVFCLVLLFCGAHSQFHPEGVSEFADVATLLEDFQAQLDEQKIQLEDQKNQIDEMMKRNGAVYVRWGRSTCDNEARTETVYSGEVYYSVLSKLRVVWDLTQLRFSGRAGGTAHTQTGGGTNYQCLPADPQWGVYQDGVQVMSAFMYGAEYQMDEHAHFGFFPNGFAQDVPCAVCYVPTRGTELMIPARHTCPVGWTKEYDGYLMASYAAHSGAKVRSSSIYYFHVASTRLPKAAGKSRNRPTRYRDNMPGILVLSFMINIEYVCVDGQPETVPGGDANQNGALFYLVEARCGSLPCPEYVEGRELTCVVCTK
ncbi:uncharacterized protein LOC144916423 [Branchiostoma floridae x Branchiostoma belcheri]